MLSALTLCNAKFCANNLMFVFYLVLRKIEIFNLIINRLIIEIHKQYVF